jgi:putative transposase
VIQRCRSEYPVKLMCRCLNVCTSGYYAWTTRGPSVRARANRRRVDRMREIHAESDRVIGAPRRHETLTYEGERVGRHRVARLMAADGLYGLPQCRRWRRKASGRRPVPVGNHVNRDFSAAEPNTRCATDITYIRTAEAWLYLCVVIDLYSRAVVGWSMSRRQDRQLVRSAVLMALWQRDSAEEPVVLHSDRGTQFTSGEYQAFLADHNLVCSMSALGHCGDNAAVESFFGMLKRERVNRRRYQRIAEARTDVFDYIEVFYNRARRHSHLGDVSPEAFEQASQ